MATSACSSGRGVAHGSRRSPRKAPSPRTAWNVSPWIGECTTPSGAPSASSSATLTAQAGKP